MEYSMPVTEPTIVAETPVKHQAKVEDKPVAPSKPKPTTPITQQRPRSVTDQYVKPQTSSRTPTRQEVSAEDSQKEIERLERLISKGVVVRHIGFGTGTITKVDKEKKHIRVKFDVGEKMFLFPDAFLKGYLSI